MHAAPRSPLGSRGFTLVEALVALLVLSFGLLGLAGMQMKALQGAHAGYQRAIASLAAQDAQERVWRALSDSYPACPEVSDYRPWMASWQAQWSAFLGGLTEAPITARENCVYDVRVRWDEPRFGDTEDVLTYRFSLPGGPR